MANETLARICAALFAVMGWFGIGAQITVTFGLVAEHGTSLWSGVWSFLGYFTVLTNIVVAATLTMFAIGGRWRPSNSAMTAVTCYILIVGVVFVTLLQHLYDWHGLHLIADRTMHHVMPILTLVFWLAFVPKGTLAWRDVLAWLAFPFAYLIYAVLRGLFEGFYPYPFIDVSKIGWTQMALNSLGLIGVFLVVGLGAIAVDRAMGRRA